MADIKETIEREIREYERDRNVMEKEAITRKIKAECYNEFISCLRGILIEIEKNKQEN